MSSTYSWRNFHPDASIHYIKSVSDANAYLADFTGPAGFDLEWRPSFKKGEPEHPVALVQLANSNTILLIQISRMSEFPQTLRDFLENPKYPKAGVGIQNDAKKFFRDCNISVRNCVDLSLLARSVDNDRWKGKYRAPLGLARLIEAYEDSAMPKGKIARTNWELELSDIQAEYAANDAHAGFLLYDRLSKMLTAMSKPPDLSCYCFDSLEGIFFFPSNQTKYWGPHNPDYDPGPPPPPRPKPTASNTLAAGVPVSSSSPASALLAAAPAPDSLSSPNDDCLHLPSIFLDSVDHTPTIKPSYPRHLRQQVRTQRNPASAPIDSLPRSSVYSPPPPTRRSGQSLSHGGSSNSSTIPSHAGQHPRHHVDRASLGVHHESRLPFRADPPQGVLPAMDSSRGGPAHYWPRRTRTTQFNARSQAYSGAGEHVENENRGQPKRPVADRLEGRASSAHGHNQASGWDMQTWHSSGSQTAYRKPRRYNQSQNSTAPAASTNTTI